ncbi:Late embryogenesis abundant protein (LEA) family protein [Forsythia ovata]|uniref:Late embryogenesis abundant protein (LEA) family protein n=1 Tax=Forsythia ovata TaxID=205694 RepID=A0ABD1X3Q6_9LAMI
MGWMSRFLAAVTFLAIGVILSPETFGSKSEDQHPPKISTLLKLAHLLCFSTAWGAALWVTFIGGIIMFKNLPRHQFGNLQSKMFPAYFSMAAEKYQLGFLVAAFAFNLSNLVVFTPMTIKMMKQRHKIEKEANIGEETGWTKNQEVAKKNPKLAAMNKKFGMIHGLSSLANIMSFCSLAMHSWYLAVKANRPDVDQPAPFLLPSEESLHSSLHKFGIQDAAFPPPSNVEFYIGAQHPHQHTSSRSTKL